MIYSENIFVCMIVPVFVTLIFVKGNARRLELNFIIGMTACLLGAYISGFFNAVTGMGVEDTAIFISPVVEEGMKFLPLLFYFHMFEPDDDNIFLASVGIGSRTIQKLHTAIEDQQAKNERKQAEIELSESNTSVRTEAVKLNLISSNGASKIILTAPESAQLVMSTAAQAAENADLEGRLTSYAGD